MSGITLAHAFVSAKGNGTDLTLIQPSNWNDQHILKCDAYQILGNQTASNAAIQQIPLTAFMATLLAAVDMPTLAGLIGISSTGDGKLTLKTVADTGWVMCDDTSIGPASPAVHTGVAYQALFNLVYANVSDAGAPVYTAGSILSSRAAQGTAAAAWAAGCVVTLPKQLGRAFVAAGAGAGLTSRPLGTSFGEESHALTVAELAAHTHANTLTDPGHQHGTSGVHVDTTTSGGPLQIPDFNGAGGGPNPGLLAATNTTGITISNASQGSGTPHNNTQASAAWNVMIKL